MTESTYRTAPDPNETGWPKGVKYIIGNEGCERFSFYGMKSILQVHLTSLFAAQGFLEEAAAENAQEMVHLFVAGVYALPMIGAIVSDRLLGKYHTIISLSLVYCLGHLVLSIGENSIGGMSLGLALIAIGSGGIKPCVSAHVGDQFGKGNWHLVEKVFQAFYFIINFGSFFATLLIPVIRANPDWIPIVNQFPEEQAQRYATSVAFAIPGVLMFLATIAFWMGRKVFIHVPPMPGGRTGLLDAISSTLLFVGFIGLPMFGWHAMPNYAFWPLVVVCIVFGLWVFEERQAMDEDDGFLAVMIHSLGALFRDRTENSGGEPSDVKAASLERHWFFGSAARHFGNEAAEGPRAVLRIISVFFLVSVFWALFDQHASSWVRQAKRMDLEMTLPIVGNFTMLPSQIQALNPLMVMLLIPFNNFVIYPQIERAGFRMSPLRRMSIGMIVASAAFAAVAVIQVWIDSASEAHAQAVASAAAGATVVEAKVHVLWQVIPYLIMTQAEVMVSITGLEFAYTQAPKRMKSTIMGFWLLSVSLGNVLTAGLTRVSQKMDWDLAEFFWIFAGLMAAAGVLFALRAKFYVTREYTQ